MMVPKHIASTYGSDDAFVVSKYQDSVSGIDEHKHRSGEPHCRAETYARLAVERIPRMYSSGIGSLLKSRTDRRVLMASETDKEAVVTMG